MRLLPALLLLMFSLYTVTRRRPLIAALSKAIVSVSAASFYVLAAAPDVALAEALLGAMLSTFVYLIVLKSSGKLRIGVVLVSGLFERHGKRYVGLEYDLLLSFVRNRLTDLEIIEYESTEEMIEDLKEGYIEAACGALLEPENKVLANFQILETRLAEIKGISVDLLKARELVLKGEVDSSDVVITDNRNFYVISALKDSEFVEQFSNYMKDVLKSGTFDSLVRKHIGDMS